MYSVQYTWISGLPDSRVLKHTNTRVLTYSYINSNAFQYIHN